MTNPAVLQLAMDAVKDDFALSTAEARALLDEIEGLRQLLRNLRKKAMDDANAGQILSEIVDLIDQEIE